jgi:hypothetical protein
MAKFTPVWTLVACLASGGILHAQEMTKPLGKWERKIDKHRVTLIIEDNRLHIHVAGGDVSGSAHADYTMTRDGVLFGIITSLECDDEDKEAEGIKDLLNAPFSFRFRIDEGALLISDVKTINSGGSKDDEQLNGRFKAAASASRPAVVPTTSYTYPTFIAPITTPPSPTPPPPPTPVGASFTTPTTGTQYFNYFMGWTR